MLLATDPLPRFTAIATELLDRRSFGESMLLPLALPSLISGLKGNGAAVISTVFVSLFFVGVFAGLLYVAVVGESLASERHPIAVQGLAEVASGRSLPPEAISGTFWGYVYGALTIGASALIQYGAARVLADPSASLTVSEAFGVRWPTTYGLISFAGGIIGAFMVLYAVALFSRWRVTARVALLLPALIAVSAMALSTPVPMAVASMGVPVLITAFVVWRYGYVAGAIAFWLPGVVSAAFAFLSSGSSEFVTAGVISVILALVPLAVVMVAYRRQMTVK